MARVAGRARPRVDEDDALQLAVVQELVRRPEQAAAAGRKVVLVLVAAADRAGRAGREDGRDRLHRRTTTAARAT
ncbi:hypothetical protein B8W95_13355, partial [Staphylococcus pasteuri]